MANIPGEVTKGFDLADVIEAQTQLDVLNLEIAAAPKAKRTTG